MPRSEHAADPGTGTPSENLTTETARRPPEPVPSSPPRRLQTLLLQLIATAGVVGIGVAIGAIMTSNHTRGWLIGLVVAAVSAILTVLVLRSPRG